MENGSRSRSKYKEFQLQPPLNGVPSLPRASPTKMAFRFDYAQIFINAIKPNPKTKNLYQVHRSLQPYQTVRQIDGENSV